MRVLDLFSGIGGFSLGLENAGMVTEMFVEIDPKARRVLRKHWPHVEMHDDVNTIGIKRGQFDLICGGFPCQDISRAGKMEGIGGEKSGLWGQFYRLIREGQPNYVIIENVARLRSDGLVTVLQNLNEIGYDAEWHCIPATAVGLPQERDRIYIVAYARSLGYRRSGWVGRWISSAPEARQHGWCEGAQGYVQIQAEPCVGRTCDGLPADVDRCRLLGNAVIPKIVEVIGRAILSVHNAQ